MRPDPARNPSVPMVKGRGGAGDDQPAGFLTSSTARVAEATLPRHSVKATSPRSKWARPLPLPSCRHHLLPESWPGHLLCVSVSSSPLLLQGHQSRRLRAHPMTSLD